MPPRLQPFQIYYPSARVRLIVRLEDYGDPATPAPAAKPTTLKKGITDKTSQNLQVQQRDGAFVLVGPGDDPTHIGSPQQQMSSGDGYTQVIDGIIPITADFKQNGIRTPDQLTLEFKFRDLPIDPRAMRACAVQFFLGTVSAEDWQRGARGELRPASQTTSGIAVPMSVIPDDYVDPFGRSRTNLRFEGWVDEFDDEFSKDSIPMVRFDCTDNTRLLIEQEVPPKLTIGTKKPIDEAIADYLANFPQFRGLSVQYLPAIDRSRIPVLGKVLAKTKFQPKLGPPPAGGGGSGKLMVWDYLTDVCGSVGHIVRVVGTRVVIQQPRTLYNGRLPQRADDPFTGRVLPDGRTLSERLYLLGENVDTLKFKRRYTRNVPVNVEVRSYDIKRKTTRVQRFPAKGDRVKRLHPGDTADEKWKVITVRGISDDAILRAIAQAAYEQLGRRELGATLVSKNLASFGGGNLDPDALDAQPGDSFRVEVLRPSIEEGDTNVALEVGGQVQTRAAEFLRALGFSAGFADAYQRAVSSASFPTLFRAQTIGMRWDAEKEGIVITGEVVNYVEVRSDKELPAGEEITAADVVNAGSPSPVKVSDEGAAV